MSARRKQVCFAKRNGDLVVFKAKKTNAPCSQQDQARFFTKRRVKRDEVRALFLLDDSGVSPRCLGYNRTSGERFDVYMENTGVSLENIPRADFQRLWPWLQRWLRLAIRLLRDYGIRHDDLAHRAPGNITYKPSLGFRIIDYGHTTQTADYDANAAANVALDHIERRLLRSSRSRSRR